MINRRHVCKLFDLPSYYGYIFRIDLSGLDSAPCLTDHLITDQVSMKRFDDDHEIYFVIWKAKLY